MPRGAPIFLCWLMRRDLARPAATIARSASAKASRSSLGHLSSKETRSEPKASFLGMPMAESTWLGSSDPDEQADPAETSKPCWSRARMRVSESMEGTTTLTMPGRRSAPTLVPAVGRMPVPSAQRRA